jgi:hypothetical protein
MDKFVVLTRADCSLCERFIVQLQAALARASNAPAVEFVDIDRDVPNDVRAAYTAAVPVLFAITLSMPSCQR